jgi:hypothetical protein
MVLIGSFYRKKNTQTEIADIAGKEKADLRIPESSYEKPIRQKEIIQGILENPMSIHELYKMNTLGKPFPIL